MKLKNKKSAANKTACDF